MMGYSPAHLGTKLFTKDLNTEEFVEITKFDPSEWMITSISAYAFKGCRSIDEYDARTILQHNTGVFYGSTISTLKLDNSNGVGIIDKDAFANCSSLTLIEDASTKPWATLNNLSFSGINENVTINSQTFGLYKQSTGFTLSPMDSGIVYALAFGEYTFTCPAGASFGDGTTSKVLALGAGNKIQDLTDMLRIEYLTLVISSNMSEAQFELSYTDSDGATKEDTVTVGSHLLKVTKGTVVTVTPVSTYNGLTTPAATTVAMASASNSKTMDYVEEVNVYIADTSGNLYTEAEWTASGKTNDQAEGVCVMCAKSGGFIIAKEDVSSSSFAWGGYDKPLTGVASALGSGTAVFDFDGIDNTSNIIEQCAGYASNGITGAPAAEACDAYTFPSGQTGYLPATGELKCAYDNKLAVQSATKLIGGTTMKSDYYWSSTQNTNTLSWAVSWGIGTISYNRKYNSFLVRAFAAYGHLSISSTLATKFTLSYTNNYGDVVTEKVSQGGHSLNVKNGTQVTVTPDAIGNITAEPQTFIWEGFSHACHFAFAKDAGVYIQHVNGSLYTESEWIAGGYANSDANGVTILSETMPAFVIAKQDASSSDLMWGGYNKTIGDVVTTTSNASAIIDNDGVGNTSKIIEQLNGYNDGDVTGAPAAEACAAYTFPNGKKGYLPALGEWKYAYDNKTAVQSATKLIGGTTMKSDYYWSSTQYNAQASWTLNWSDGSMGNYRNKSYTNDVRAFSTL